MYGRETQQEMRISYGPVPWDLCNIILSGIMENFSTSIVGNTTLLLSRTFSRVIFDICQCWTRLMDTMRKQFGRRCERRGYRQQYLVLFLFILVISDTNFYASMLLNLFERFLRIILPGNRNGMLFL